jgi:exodeoxyribonuclease VII small subunit
MAKAKEDSAEKLKFEDALERLEKIVAQLEEGELALDESLKIFEEGIKLSRLCSSKLEEAEKKIEILMKNKEGQLEKKTFPAGADKEQNDDKELF